MSFMQDQMEGQRRAEELNAEKWLVAVTLATSVIEAANRPHSVDEAYEVARSCYYKLYPAHGNGHYESWVSSGISSKTHQ
jgi:hypothetical protein